MATFLVTGANRGIGLEYCRQLKARGDDVVAVCRQSSDELVSLGARVESGLELSDSQSIDDLVNRLAGLSLDGVILNAGILQSMGFSDLDPNGIRRQFEVNAMGIQIGEPDRLQDSRIEDDAIQGQTRQAVHQIIDGLVVTQLKT